MLPMVAFALGPVSNYKDPPDYATPLNKGGKKILYPLPGNQIRIE